MFAALFLFSLLVVQNTAQVVGFWYHTWGDGKSAPSDTTHSFAFDGTLLPSAISDSSAIQSKLIGTQIITIGGDTTFWNKTNIETMTNLIAAGAVGSPYKGVAWDIEQGDANLDFSAAFKAVKAKGLSNWVTVSHSAPYGPSDKAKLIKDILADPNVDYISPQLYTLGTETSPSFLNSTPWSDYANTNAKIVPSLPVGSQYTNTYCYFLTNYGIKLAGYIQWSQSGFPGPSSTSPLCPSTTTSTSKSPKSSTTSSTISATYVCGKTWATAQCSVTCPTGLNGECPDSHSCYAGVNCSLTAAANEAVVVSETQNSDGSTSTTTTITTSEGIPGYGVALLCIASLVIVVLVVLIALLTSKKQSERV